jgi:hypothetical protein
MPAEWFIRSAARTMSGTILEGDIFLEAERGE